ncbi:MAG: hypothetical protein QQN41_09920 [Nitrosopumilus sp.]
MKDRIADFTKKINRTDPKCPECNQIMFSRDRKFYCVNFSCDVLWRYGE